MIPFGWKGVTAQGVLLVAVLGTVEHTCWSAYIATLHNVDVKFKLLATWADNDTYLLLELF